MGRIRKSVAGAVGRAGPVALAMLLVASCAQLAEREPARTDPFPQATPYVGLVVGEGGEGGEGVLVLDVVAGPAALAGLLPGDRIISVDGKPASSRRFVEMLQSSKPNARLKLRTLRNGAPRDVELVVGSLETWASPSQTHSRVAAVEESGRQERVWLDDVEQRVDRVAPELAGVREQIDLELREVAREPLGYNRLPLNREVLIDPGILVALDAQLAQDLDPGADAPARVTAMLCRILALECAAAADAVETAPTFEAFTAAIAAANAEVRRAFAGVDRRKAFADVRSLLRHVAVLRTLLDRPNAQAGIRAMGYSERVDVAALAGAFDRLVRNAVHAPAPAGTKRAIPAALRARVEGEILDFASLGQGYVVIGGPGPNRYRMSQLYAVIDPDGEDVYVWDEDAQPAETQTVIDSRGNDRYEAAIGGPGAGWLGAAVLLDLQGDDRYSTSLGGCGAGVLGFGMLIDKAGNDVYRCDAWSLGAALYGGGVLLEGSGADEYISQSRSQGAGGPGGAGLLVDGGGSDLYRANGPVPSTYGTPGTYMSFSQGVGFGIRPYDHGGFGALIDRGGNDRYEGGEFSQGGGYAYGVGLLHDSAGNDFYYGNRYAQGFASHQAAGLLVDAAGDDVYWAMAAAGQGAAWDQAVAMLFDASGNDFYRAESLSQGAAAQQSRAWLHDAGGDDVYMSASPASQGAAGANTYHLRPEAPVFSLGVLVDATGEDRYSSGLGNGASRLRFDPLAPGGAGNAGVALDE